MRLAHGVDDTPVVSKGPPQVNECMTSLKEKETLIFSVIVLIKCETTITLI